MARRLGRARVKHAAGAFDISETQKWAGNNQPWQITDGSARLRRRGRHQRLLISGSSNSRHPGTSDTSGNSTPNGLVASTPTEEEKPPSV